MKNPIVLKNRYQLKKRLGSGGLAKTFLAVDNETQTSCVVKMFSLEKVEEWKVVELFEREGKILKHLNHPNIPRYIDYFVIEKRNTVQYFLVQEYIQGKTLAEWVADGRHFTEQEVVDIAIQIAKTLEYLQSFSPQIVHRDIKPQNVLLTPEKKVYLIDFGAVQAELRLESNSTIVGTLGYIAPEQVKGKVVPASDIYSLGGVLVYLLSHISPIDMEEKNMRLQFKPYVRISKLFCRVLEKMLEPDHSKRYVNAKELLKVLRAVQSQRTENFSQSDRRRMLRYLLASALIVLFVAGISAGLIKVSSRYFSRPSSAERSSSQSLVSQPSEAPVAQPSKIVEPAGKQTEPEVINTTTSSQMPVSDLSETVTKIPDIITDAVVAGGGRWVLLKMQSLPSLAVYDAETRSIVKMLPLASLDFLYAAGGDTLLVYYPENNLLQTWDLATFQKVKTKPNPVGAVITYLAMGHSNNAIALVRYAEGTQQLSNAGTYVLDIGTLQSLTEPDERGRMPTGHNSSYRDFVHRRADGAMRHITEWATSHTPSGVGLLSLSGNSFTTRYEHDSEGYLALGDDLRIYTQQGSILNLELQQVGKIAGHKLIPGIGGALFLAVAKDGNMSIYPSGSTIPVGPAGQYPGLDPNAHPMAGMWAKTPFVFDRHIIFDPSHDRLILIPPGHEDIRQRSFDIETFMKKAGIDYLVVISAPKTLLMAGQQWQYQIEVLSSSRGIAYALEYAPEGMNISKKGLVSWNVPGDLHGKVQVVVLIKNKDGESLYHNLDLHIQ